VGGDGRQPGLHVGEQGPRGLGTQVFNLEAVVGGAYRVHHLHRGEVVKEDVFPGLVEELVGQGHMLVVHEVHV